MIRWFAILLITAQLSIPANWNILSRPVQAITASFAAQSPVEFTNDEPQVQFGQGVTFHATIQPSDAISQAYITIQPQGQDPII